MNSALKLIILILATCMPGAPFAKETPADLNIIFPDIHFDRSWEVSNASSLWTYFVTNNLTEPIIRVNTEAKYRGTIANSWMYSSDKKELTISLNKKYKFHDGSTIRPQDVYNSFYRLLRLKSSAHSDIERTLCSGTDCKKNISIKGSTIKLKMNQVANGFLFNLSTPEYGIVPKSYGKNGVASKEDLKNLSGPYKLVHFSPKKIKLQAFTAHPLYSSNMPQRVNILEIKSEKKAIEFYKKNKNTVLIGSAYYISRDLLKLQGSQFKSSYTLTEFIQPNFRSKKIKNKNNLQRLRFALSKTKKHLKLSPEISELTDQLFPPDSPARLKHTALVKKPKDTKKPLELKMIVLDWMKGSPSPQELKLLLGKYNIHLNIKYFSSDQKAQIFTERNYDLFYIYSGVSALDPIVELTYMTKHPVFDMSFENKTFVSKLEKIKSEVDPQKYNQGLRDLHRHIIESGRTLPLFHTRMVYLTNSKYKIEDMNYFDGGLDLWKWKLKSNE